MSGDPKSSVDPKSDKSGLLQWLRRGGAAEKAEPAVAAPAAPAPTRRPRVSDEDTRAHAVVQAETKPLTSDVMVRYVDGGELARGGMGSIRKVFDQNLHRSVAMKVLFPEHRADAKVLRRFADEAQIMGQLEHPNIVPVHDYGTDGDTQYFTMLLVRGKTLTEIIGHRGDTLSYEEMYKQLNIYLRVCDAVAFAHSRGVIHRDLKPDNIMIGNFGEVYLMDWGIARLLGRRGGIASTLSQDPPKTTFVPAVGMSVDVKPVDVSTTGVAPDETGTVVGTFHYMAPEQATAQLDKLDERTDVFLLGGVLYEMLTKQPPYMGATVIDVVRQAQKCVIPTPEMLTPNAGIPKALQDICMRCLEKDPAKRYPSVLELKRHIEDFLKGGASFPVKKFPAGTMLMKEGAFGDEIYIIHRGTVQVYTEDKNGRKRGLATLTSGAVVGEAAVFRGGARSASVVAVDDVEAMCVTRKQLDQGLGINNWLGNLCKSLADRFAVAQERFSRSNEELSALQVINWVMQYFILYASTGPKGRREVSHSHLLASAVQQFVRPQDEVAAILASTKAFTVDAERDRLWFSAGYQES
jgi:eukaryotic-like serine/threonine-protein kinase